MIATCKNCGAHVEPGYEEKHLAWHELVDVAQLRLMIQRIVKEEANNFNLSAAHKIGMMRYIEDGLDSLPDVQDDRCRFGQSLQGAMRKILVEEGVLRGSG